MEEDFESLLMRSYPALFAKNGKGESYCICGADVPKGWRSIVFELCGAIDYYIKSTYVLKFQATSKKYYFWHFLQSATQTLHHFIIKTLCKKLNKHEFNKPWFELNRKLIGQVTRYVKYDRIHPPEINIEQIKQKFGGLRFYYSGGDTTVAGMIYFAEHLCKQTCEVSGEKGELHRRAAWYKTLSHTVANTMPHVGYTPVKPNE